MPFFAENSANKPTILSEPDTRFATSMLSSKYRKHAVPGEVLMDKTSGEIFIKRPSDEKIVSFFQNKQSYYDLLMELRLNLVNNSNIIRTPLNSNYTGNSFLYSVNFDLANNYRENLINLIEADAPDFYPAPKFKIGAKSNGFFIKIATRDCDKAVVEYATTLKDKNYGYTETDEQFGTNLCLLLNITNENINVDIQKSVYCALNKTCTITLTEQEYDTLTNNGQDDSALTITFGFSSCTIKNFLTDDGLNDLFLFAHINLIHGLLAPDGRVEIAETNIMAFTDSLYNSFLEEADDSYITPSYAHVIAVLDKDTVYKMLNITKKAISAESVVVSEIKPETYAWIPNCIWAEKIRNVSSGGSVSNTTAITTFDALETYFSTQINTGGVELEEP